MPRQVRDANLETRTQRHRLPVRKEPYYRLIEPQLYLGYRKLPNTPGTWLVRRYNGKADSGSPYSVKNLMAGTRPVIADDYSDANGVTIMTFAQAQDAAKTHRAPIVDGQRVAAVTVLAAIDDYEKDLAARGGDVSSVARVRLHMPDRLTSKAVALLTANDLKSWRNGLRQKLSVGSINRICNSLRAALNAVADNDKHTSRHAWEVGLAALSDGEVSARNVILADNQIRKIVAAAYGISEAFGLLVEAAAVTGARVGQLARLTVGDLQAHRLMVPSSRKGKGKKISHTPIAVPASLVLKLKQAARGKGDRSLLLVKPSGEPWGKSQHNRPFARAAEAAGCDPDEVTAYALRHSSIVRQIKANVPIRVVAVLHDTSVAMIESHYSTQIAHVAENVPVLDLSETRTNVVSLKM